MKDFPADSCRIPRARLAVGLSAVLLAACGSRAPEVPVIDALLVSIDADNNCSMENQVVECSQVASTLQARYPTSKPRVDICLDKQARYEAAAEVMQSVTAAGFTLGSFDCTRPPTAG